MDKEKMVQVFEDICGNVPDSLFSLYPDLRQIMVELHSLISAHGGEAEVGDEEREKLIHHLRSEDLYRSSFCPQCEQIIALLRQPRRTVSGEWVEKLMQDIRSETPIGLRGFDESVYHQRIKMKILNSFAELGIAVEGPKKEGEEKI